MANAVALASGTVDVQAVTGNVRLMGFSIREAAGSPAAAKLVIRNGTAATDPIVVVLNLNASESVRENFMPNGIVCPAGIFIDRESGTTEGAVWVA